MSEISTKRLHTTTAQFGIWVAHQSDPMDPGYLTAELITLDGPLDTVRFSNILTEVLAHCAALHMRFEFEEGTLWQRPQPACVPLERPDFSAQADPEGALEAWMAASLRVPCDITTQPLFRCALACLGPLRHAWYLQVHHIALDGFGYSLLQQAVASRYNQLAEGRAVTPLPDWQVHRVVAAEAAYRRDGPDGSSAFGTDRAFWGNHLRDVPEGARLAPLHEASNHPWRQSISLAAARSAAVQAAARTVGIDWTAWLLTVAGLWLGRHSGQRDLCFGIPVMNRLGTPALGVPCMAMNVVPFSVRLRPEASFGDTARASAGQLRAMRPHLFYRYGWIRRDLGLMAEGRFMFSQAINLMPFERAVRFTGIASRMRSVSGGSVKDLNLILVVEQGTWWFTLEANPQGYAESRVTELLADFDHLLDELCACPADAPLRHWMRDNAELSAG